jgi:hypothetical protein
MKNTQELENKETIELLRISSLKAVKRLVSLMNRSNQDSVKLNAAKSILDFHYKQVDLVELQKNIEDLKDLVAANQR